MITTEPLFIIWLGPVTSFVRAYEWKGVGVWVYGGEERDLVQLFHPPESFVDQERDVAPW